MPPIATKREYLFEWKLLSQIIITFILLVSLEATYLYFRHHHIAPPRRGWHPAFQDDRKVGLTL